MQDNSVSMMFYYFCRVQEEQEKGEDAEDLYGGTTDDEQDETTKKGAISVEDAQHEGLLQKSLTGHHRMVVVDYVKPAQMFGKSICRDIRGRPFFL